MEMESIIWLIIIIAAVIIEIATLGLTSIWFAGGAVVAFIMNLVGASIPAQIVVFFIISIILICLTKPLKQRFNKDRTKTNADSLLGRKAMVTITINNKLSQGQVLVQGMEWSARSSDDDIQIEKDQQVRITAIEGVKLIVERI